MSNRFYVPEIQPQSTAQLIDQQAHHALNVMRLKVGDEVTLFDGMGHEFSATLCSTTRKTVELEVADQTDVDREAKRQLTIAAAIPKGDRSRWMVEKLTEIGVKRFVPLVCQRSSVKVSSSLLAKFEKYVIEASKQCGRNRLMEIGEVTTFQDLVRSDDSNATKDAIKLIGSTVEPFETPAQLATSQSLNQDSRLVILIGPEGGFTSEEMEIARSADFQAFSLASSILRIETAAVTSAAVFINLPE